MGIPEGVTLVAGGGFHGKSTLLSALSWGVYDHVAGDGREYRGGAGRRGQDQGRGRSERGGGGHLGHDRGVARRKVHAEVLDPERLRLDLAGGEHRRGAGGRDLALFLVDEDTSATNFMIRDERMRELVSKEPITPVYRPGAPLRRSLGVSTVVVVGGVGDYLDVADRVILMEDYEPSDATPRAREVASKFPPRAPARRQRHTPAERPPRPGLLHRPPARQARDRPRRGVFIPSSSAGSASISPTSSSSPRPDRPRLSPVS